MILKWENRQYTIVFCIGNFNMDKNCTKIYICAIVLIYNVHSKSVINHLLAVIYEY